MATIEQLFQTIQERKRPEDVAQMVLALMKGHLTSSERLILEKDCWQGEVGGLECTLCKKAVGGVVGIP